MERDWTGLKGKKVFIRTTERRIYTGIIQDVINSEFFYTIYLIDKFGKAVMLRNDNILELKEEE